MENKMNNNADNNKQYLFDKPENIKRLLKGFYLCCILLVILDFIINRHIYHSWENLWSFYAIYGFVACVLLVHVATWMRTFLMRDENYYEQIDAAKTRTTDLDKSQSEQKGERNVDD